MNWNDKHLQDMLFGVAYAIAAFMLAVIVWALKTRIPKRPQRGFEVKLAENPHEMKRDDVGPRVSEKEAVPPVSDRDEVG